jgi:hypothetical protein
MSKVDSVTKQSWIRSDRVCSAVLLAPLQMRGFAMNVTLHLLRAGSGHMSARWVSNRGILLLLYSNALMAYDVDLGTVLERIPLPRRCKPFVRWLDTRGHGGCFGAAAEGQLRTLIVEHEARQHARTRTAYVVANLRRARNLCSLAVGGGDWDCNQQAQL